MRWLLVAASFAFFHDLGLFDQFSKPSWLATVAAAPDDDPAAIETSESAAEMALDEHNADVHADSADHDANGAEEPHGHTNPVTPVLVAIVMILFLAKVGGDLFERLRLPAVLGELVVGVLLGNLGWLTGWHILDPLFVIPDSLPSPLPHDLTVIFYNPAAILKILASIGVVLLLFEVGLESTVKDMMAVGVTSLIVAVLGVIAPMGLGYVAARLIVPDLGWQVHVFIGATLCATSVGITARVLKDLGRSQQRESKIILGAAVIDDVLGLVVLTVVAGIITQGAENFNFLSLLLIIGKAFFFLAGAVLLGTKLVTRPVFKAANALHGHGMLVAAALVICFGFSWLATVVQLEPIVGAFAAGLILDHVQYRELGQKENRTLEDALGPLTALLVPIFFVQMGTQVKLQSFADPSVWGLALAITFMAILGKQACALGVREKGLNSLAVGLGMIPRGEVGLIFAEVGRSLRVPEIVNGKTVLMPVIGDTSFSAVVVMVLVTTMVTPPLLKWAMLRKPLPEAASELAPTVDVDDHAPAHAK